MNSFWSVLDWFFPAIRLVDDLRLDDLEAPSGRPYAIQTRTLSTSSRSHPRRPLPSDAEWQNGRQREQRKDAERERDIDDTSRLRKDNEELRRRVRELEASLNSTRNALSTLSQNAHSPLLSLPDPALQTAYDDLRTLHATVQQTLRERNEEVSSLRTFLTKTDELSGAQLVQATHDLNIEIIQLSASIVDRFAPSFTRKFDFVRQSDRDLLHPALGVRTTQLLEDLQHSADPTFVQYAIQAWQVAFVGKQMSAFCFGAPSEVQRILTAVFQRIQAAGKLRNLPMLLIANLNLQSLRRLRPAGELSPIPTYEPIYLLRARARLLTLLHRHPSLRSLLLLLSLLLLQPSHPPQNYSKRISSTTCVAS